MSNRNFEMKALLKKRKKLSKDFTQKDACKKIEGKSFKDKNILDKIFWSNGGDEEELGVESGRGQEGVLRK